VNIIAAICMAAMLLTTTQSLTCISCSAAMSQDHASVEPGMFWTLSSRWRWNASGVADHAGWRVETEDWNDTLTIQKVSGDELTFRLKRVGQGVLEANGSFIIAGRVHDSWTIDREYSITVNATTFRDADGRPVRWVSNVKELEASRWVPQMWIDKDYRNVEVQFRVSGSDRLSLGGVVFDTWIVSYRGLTTGYWSAQGNHSIGFKEESLEYDETRGLLLRDTYRGIYGMKTREGGWNETETYAATAIDSNFPLFGGVENRNLTNGVIMAGAFVAAGIAVLVIIHRRRFSRSEQPDTDSRRLGGIAGTFSASARRLR
jgi:hypothetical protein